MAAGQGFIEFSTGDVLTAAAANGYLASQTVMVFANATARTAAITTPYEGMVSYLKDTDAIQYYSGTAWVSVGGGGGGGGKVLQVVNATYSTNATSSSSTMADTGLTASITPSASTSKILVIATQAGCGKYASSSASALGLMLRRNTTDLVRFEDIATYTGTAVENYVGSCSVSYLDSPATTSSTTYKTQFRNSGGAGTVTIQSTLGGGLNAVSTITLMEIGA